MKTIKFIISFCIIFIGMLIIGESHIFYLDNFYTRFNNTTLYLQHITTKEEMINDILNSADRNEVEVFTYINSPRSIFLKEVDIFGTANVEESINENLNIFAGEYTSLFLGNIHFTFNDLKNIQSMENIHNFYVIGNKEQIHQFKMDLIDKYAGNHPKEGSVGDETKNIVAIWLLIISIILLISHYDVILQKKENIIRISMGERISKIIGKNVLLDSCVFGLLFAKVIFILSKYTSVFFKFHISLLLFFVLLFFNGLLYLNLYSYHLKEVFSNTKGSKKLLSLNYSLKLFTAIITIFIISSNIGLIFESYSFYQQKSFFENHADYYYTQLYYRPIENTFRGHESDVVSQKFYQEFFNKFNATLLAKTHFLNGEGIIANKHAFNYLSQKIKELRDIPLDKNIYFLLPKKLSGNAEIIDQLTETIRFYEGDNFTYDYALIFYQDDVKIISIDEFYPYGSKLIENPVIIYNNTTPNPIEVDASSSKFKAVYHKDIMYKIADDEFNQFIEEHNLTDEVVTKTNVLENYQNKWTIAKRILYINLIFSVLVLFLEFIIISSIIKLEYEVNAIELAIKKVLGHSLIEKNKKIILMTVITTILSILIAIIIALIIKLDEIYYLAVGGTTIFFLELSIITFYIHKIENAKIQKILKGGNI